jgi:leucyl-tRNA synthetase
MPVDKYVGGIEHAATHLLYARFITKALRDMGYLSFGEPFPSLFHQGIITGKDGKKMSKRDGAVSPDVLIDQYGADVFRLYLGFGFFHVDGGPWDDVGINAIVRFVARIGKVLERYAALAALAVVAASREVYKSLSPEAIIRNADLEYVRHFTIKHVTDSLECFSFNTAIARIMEYLNAIQKYQTQTQSGRSVEYEKALLEDLILLLAPLAPHLAEEMWEYIGNDYSVHNCLIPVCDEAKLARNFVEIAVQVNGTLRDVIEVDSNADEEAVKAVAAASDKVKTHIEGKEIKKIIYVEKKLVNIVC